MKSYVSDDTVEMHTDRHLSDSDSYCPRLFPPKIHQFSLSTFKVSSFPLFLSENPPEKPYFHFLKMAVPCSQTDGLLSTTQIPLAYEDQEDEAHLSKSLNQLETILRVFGFCQHSFLSLTLSWLSFLILGIALPVVMIHLFSHCIADCKKYRIHSFEIQVLVFQCLVAAISLVCISYSLRQYGFRKFLFVDRSHGHMAQFRDEYVKKINVRKTFFFFYF